MDSYVDYYMDLSMITVIFHISMDWFKEQCAGCSPWSSWKNWFRWRFSFQKPLHWPTWCSKNGPKSALDSARHPQVVVSRLKWWVNFFITKIGAGFSWVPEQKHEGFKKTSDLDIWFFSLGKCPTFGVDITSSSLLLVIFLYGGVKTFMKFYEFLKYWQHMQRSNNKFPRANIPVYPNWIAITYRS